MAATIAASFVRRRIPAPPMVSGIAAAPEGHDRKSGGHGFEHGNAEALVLAQRDEDAGSGERRTELAVGYFSRA